MTWAYSTSLAADKDRVRLYIGDTDTNNQQFSDEEINALLTDNADDIFETSAQFCDSLAAKYARSNSLRIDGFSISLDKRSDHYKALATRLRAKSGSTPGTFPTPVVTGISIDEMDSERDDTDRNPSRFEIGQFTHPGNAVIEKGDEDGSAY